MLTSMSLDSRLEHEGGGRFQIIDGGQVLARFPFESLRISVSWKARVFGSAEEECRVDQHLADLSFDEVLLRFGEDLERRGLAYYRPADPLRDPTLTELLARTYLRLPATSD